jgi:RNA 2',3'-cyclic 3'-phosphodiesterase
MQTYRTFIAIEVPGEIRRQIRAYIDQLRAAFSDVRASWSREDNLHLTLKFLGDVEVSRIDSLSQACTHAARDVQRFELALTDCGTFPPHGKPKVLWLGIGYAGVSPAASPEARASPSTTSAKIERIPEATENPLVSLHAAIERTCASAGFAREARPYHPHLTIARLREAKDSRALAERHRQSELAAKPFVVSEVVLFSSELSSHGSKHTPLSHHRLA